MIFLDSSVIIAFKNDDDVNHEKAQALISKIHEGEYGPAVITELVFAEVVTVLLLKKGLQAAVEVGDILREAKEVSTIKASTLFEKAWEVFKEQKKGVQFSFVDASTIACLRERSIKYIATFDRDFEKVDGIKVVSD